MSEQQDYYAAYRGDRIRSDYAGFTIQAPKMSEWKCYLFGATRTNGWCWQPHEGQVPNWFWRKMQYLAFGNRWVKDK